MQDENLMLTLEPMQIEANKSEIEAQRIKVTDAVSCEQATAMLKVVMQKQKEFKKSRDTYIKPMKESIKQIDDRFKEPIKKLEVIEGMLRSELNTYLTKLRKEEEARAAEEKRRAEEEALKRCQALEQTKEKVAEYDDVTHDAIDRAIENEQNKLIEATAKTEKINISPNGASVSTVWDFEVTDKSQLPLEFLKVDEVAIRKAVGSGCRNIPGVDIFQKQQIAVR